MILICIIEMRKVIMTRQSSQDLHFSPHNYTNYKKNPTDLIIISTEPEDTKSKSTNLWFWNNFYSNL